jgi:hypothetical protein
LPAPITDHLHHEVLRQPIESALVSPVWFRWNDAFEVVIAEDDVKLTHLRRDRRCVLVVFEATPPFRGIEVRGEARLVQTPPLVTMGSGARVPA